MQKNKILIEHIKNCKQQLKQLSSHAGILEHKGNLGIAREGFINNFLKDNLAEYINYNDGEIFDSEGKRSGQIDIVLHPISSPKLNIHKTTNLFPIETVLAVIEVKSFLDKNQINKILESCREVKSLKNINKQYKNSLWNLPYIIFAYDGNKKETILNNIDKYINKSDSIINLIHLPDIIYILDQNFCLVKCRNYYEIGQTVTSCYKEVFIDTEPLLGVFKYLLKLTEEWYAKPEKNTMPIDDYIKNEVNTFEDW